MPAAHSRERSVVSRGAHLSRTQLARAVGSVRAAVPQPVARQLAAIGAAAAVGTMATSSARRYARVNSGSVRDGQAGQGVRRSASACRLLGRLI